MDAWVQLIRNALCCIKDLSLFKDTFLYDPSYVLQYYVFPPPLDQTTPLEVLIALAQLYVVLVTSRQGILLVLNSLGKFRRIEYILNVIQKQPTTTTPEKIVHASLLKEGFFALRFAFVGILVFFIGLGFFWLFANSFHVTETDWIGGVTGVVYALIVLEVCLVPLLYYMIVDGMEQHKKAKDIETVAQTGRGSPQAYLASIEVMTGWLPYWDKGVGLMEAMTDESSDEEILKRVAQETSTIASALDGLQLPGVADDLRQHARAIRWEGKREFVYFVLNLLAFYGYLIGIVVYYWHLEDEQPSWMRKYLLGDVSNTDADWHGNFLGDLMWTIEPVIILASPTYIDALRPKRKLKEKTK